MLEFGIPALIEVPDDAGLADVVFSRASAGPDEVMLRRRSADGQWLDVTAVEFRDQVAALAKGLIAAGIEPGDRVALMSRTRYEWTLADYAIWAAGAVTVPVYETSSAEQVEWIISDSGARAAIAESDKNAEIISGLTGKLPGLTSVWRIAGLDELAAAGSGVSDDELRARRTSRRAGDLATIIYTSGTTGRPKGCELTHRNLLAAVRNAVHGALPEVFEISGGGHAALHAARPRVRQDHRGRLPGVRGDPRSLGGHGHRRRRLARIPADVPAGRSEGVREGLQHRAAASLREPGQDQDLRRGRQRCHRLQPGTRLWAPGDRAQAAARRIRPPCVRQAARGRRRPGHATRCPGVPRSASGSATSSAAPASPCWRATA